VFVMPMLLALVVVLGLAGFAAPAEAVVYCRSVGVPVGCVARPVARAVTPGVGAPGVGVGAPGVGVRPGTPANRGGPVNRVGRR
jgi:hypothetical protein